MRESGDIATYVARGAEGRETRATRRRGAFSLRGEQTPT
jgi:hypothetical protein